VNALLVIALADHLKKNVSDEEISQTDKIQLRAETEGTIDDLAKEQTTNAKTLPRLRQMTNNTKVPGARKTTKGMWSHSEEIRAGKKDVLEPAPTKPREDPQSPNLLESPKENQEKDSDENQETQQPFEETKEESQQEETQSQDETKGQNLTLESNPCYCPSFAGFTNSENSSVSSHHDDTKQVI
jgi:hypothetical protein